MAADQDLKRVVVGTAGHIDHGKTALVGALTGVDTDRLPEEKRRGITIDLGFASLTRGDIQLSFVDVPGHERFVRNMLAGASGIDAVMLVVAADESVAPQTIEHFEICRMLGVERGIVVVTKADRAGSDMIELVQLELAELLAGSPLENAPVIVTSAKDGTGVEELKESLFDLAESTASPVTDRKPFRLPVDRAFTIRGFGTVVTGTVVSGALTAGDPVEVLPHGIIARTRRVEVHSEERQRAVDGDRASVNLADVAVDSVRRGAQLVTPGTVRPSSVVTVRLEILHSAKALRNDARIRFHHMTTEVIGRVRLAQGRELAPGATSIAQLRLDRPVSAVAGDRFVVRTYSPARTIGGGVVVDAHLPKLGRKLPAAVAIELAEAGLVGRARVLARIAGAAGISSEELGIRMGLLSAAVRSELGSDAGGLLGIGDRWIDPAVMEALEAAAVALLSRHFETNPLSLGLPRNELARKLWKSAVEPDAETKLFEEIVRRGRVVSSEEGFDLPGRERRPGGSQGKLADQIESRFAGAGLSPPSLREVQDSIEHKPKVVEGVIGFLVREGTLVRLADGLWVHRDVLEQASVRVREYQGETHDVAWFKDLFGLTRKVGIPLLEWFDRNEVTRRVGDQRRIL